MIRVLIAEDQALVRGAIVALLELEADIEVVGEVGRGDEIVPAGLRLTPDIALLDVELPNVDGISAGAELKRQLPSCKIVLLTTFGRGGYLRRALDAGASAFLLKDSPARELADALRRVVAGQRVVDPTLAVSTLEVGPNPLSAMEQRVLRAALHGAQVKEIAEVLNIVPGTVRNHLSNAIQKLHVRNKIEAAQLAEQRGWL